MHELSQRNKCLHDMKPAHFATRDTQFALSAENLEQIRMKAASMSLPLLTALCSDKTLIQSLNKPKQEI